MTKYDDLWTTIDEIAEAAIESELARNNYFRVSDGYEVAHRESDVGDALSGGKVNLPGTGPVHWIVEPDPFLVAWPDEHIKFVQGIYDKWPAAISEVFQGWTWLPDPAYMIDEINQVIRGAGMISQGEDLEGGPRIPANPDLTDLAEANGILENFEGGTVRTFRTNYTRRLELAILPNQTGLMCDIAEAMLAEAAIFNEARASVVSIADTMLAAMKASKPSASAPDSSGALLTVLGIGLSFAGVFATGGVSTAISVGRATLGALTAFRGSQRTVPVAGSDPDAVVESAVEALEQLNTDIVSEENDARAKLTGVVTSLTQTPGNYDLSAPPVLDSTTYEQLLDAPALLGVDSGRLRDIARLYLPTVADLLLRAARRLEPWSTSWTRHHDIGIASEGPHPEKVDACLALAALLTETAREIRDACAHLLIAAGDFDRTDGGVTDALRKHRHEVNHRNAPELPFDPPPNPWANKPLPLL